MKNSNGSYGNPFHTVTDTSINVEIPKNVGKSATYKVVSAITGSSNVSDGVEVTVDLSSVIKDEITASLVGKTEVVVEENATYSDEGVKVLEGKTDVTKNAKVQTTIKLDGQVVKDFSEKGNYVITYDITYKDYKKALTRKVSIK